jgi:hypothetical protein
VNINRPIHKPDRFGRGTGPVSNDRRPGKMIHQRPEQKPDQRPRQTFQQRQGNLTPHAKPTGETRPRQDIKKPGELPRTVDRNNRRQVNSVFSGREGDANRRVQQGREQRTQSGWIRPDARPQTSQNSGQYRSSPGQVYGAPMRGSERGRDFGRVSGGYSGGGFPGRGAPGGGFGSYGRGPSGGGSFRSTPSFGGGTPMARGSGGGGFYGGGFGGGSRR